MKNKMDQFFKDKLAGHVLPPSEEAWAKVEAKLSKKNSAIAWRIAAAVLLMGTFISFLYWSQRTAIQSKPSLAVDQPKKENEIKPSKEVITSTSKEKLMKKNSANAVAVTKKSSASSIQVELVRQEKNSSQQSIDEPNELIAVIIPEKKKEEKINSEATAKTKTASTTQRPIKLEFTLDDFTPEENIVATTEVKNSGLKRVWELAKEVKNGEGNLREMKNELFAVNFKKNKTKTQ